MSKNTNFSTLLLMNNKKSFLIIILLSYLLYGNTITHYYNLDDVFVIHNNKQVQRGIEAIPEIFTSRYFENPQAKFGYRPLTKAIYALEVSLFGVNPHISHFINVLLYALLAFVLFLWLRRLFESETGILFIWAVLLLWLFHPIHTEVVASLKNREEIMYLLFAISASLVFMNFIEYGKYFYLIMAILLYALSYLSKQSAISFVLVLPFLFFFKYLNNISLKSFFNKEIWANAIFKRYVIAITSLFLIGYIMYKLPSWILPPDELDLYSFENPLRYNKTLEARFSVSALAMIYYLRLLIFPHPLLFYYGLYTLPEVNISDIIVWFSVLIHIIFFILFLKLWRKNKFLLYGYIFYLLTILPFSNFMMEINGIVADRFLHGPSIGFAIVLSAFLFLIFKIPVSENSFKKICNKAKYTFFIILTLYAFKTISRNNDWKNEMTLYSRDINYLDKSVKANDILAQVIMDRIMQNNPLSRPFSVLKPSLDSIIYFYSRSLELFPENPKALNNLANIYINFYNQPKKALDYLLKAYKYKPNSFELNMNIGKCYEILRNDTLSISYYKKALDINKTQPILWQNIINVYFKLNKPDSAKYYAEEFIKYDSISDIGYASLGFYYFLKKDTVTAVSYWEKAFELNPTNYQRALSLAQYFAYKKDSLKAEYYLRKAKQLKLLN